MPSRRIIASSTSVRSDEAFVTSLPVPVFPFLLFVLFVVRESMPHRAAQFSSYVYLINYLHIEIAKLHCQRVYYQQQQQQQRGRPTLFFCPFALLILCVLPGNHFGLFKFKLLAFATMERVCALHWSAAAGRGSHNNMIVRTGARGLTESI